MKMVVLDGFTLNPGDLSWDVFEAIGELVIHDKIAMDDAIILEAIGDSEIIFTNKTPLSEKVIKKAPNLKYIGVLATGYNVVAVQAANERGIVVTNVPSYGTNAVAQYTFALLLELCHHVGAHNTSVQNKGWIKSVNDSYWLSPLVELEGKTIGLIGFGKIAQAVSKLAIAFGMQVLVYSRTIKKELENTNLKFIALDGLLEKSDVISLHCPLNEATKEIICEENIQKMKTGVMLVNTSRGGLVNENDLLAALTSRKINAAALDVVSVEPMKENNPLLNVENCIITPHIAWATKEARHRLMLTAVENLKAYQKGTLINVVN